MHQEINEKAIYAMTWRWHFYAGLYLIPFMLILSLTGLIMLFDEEIELLRYGSSLNIEAESSVLPVSEQLNAVQLAFPDHIVTQFLPAKDVDIANRFSLQGSQSEQILVTVNPYTGQVLGTIDRSNSVYNIANEIHSTLLIGDWGDYLIEVAASLGMLMLVTGLYLWVPRNKASRSSFLKIRFRSNKLTTMRDLHANIAGVLSIVLFLFFLSGLSWTGVWGAKIVQGWNTFPTYYVWGEKPQSTLTHAALNHSVEEELPWNLELAAVPESNIQPHDHSKMESRATEGLKEGALAIDRIVKQALDLGFTQYRVFFPQSETGVYTITANSMAGDVIDPRDDRTVHIDQYSGELLMDVTWGDYSIVAKLMATGVSLHQGDVGFLNKLLNVVFCLAFVFISVMGAVIWWIRRPTRKTLLGAPPKLQHKGVWKTGLATLILICALFPLAGVAIIAAFAVDWLIFSRMNKVVS